VPQDAVAAFAFDMGNDTDPAGVALEFGTVEAVLGLGVFQVFAHLTEVSAGQSVASIASDHAGLAYAQYSCQELSENGRGNGKCRRSDFALFLLQGGAIFPSPLCLEPGSPVRGRFTPPALSRQSLPNFPSFHRQVSDFSPESSKIRLNTENTLAEKVRIKRRERAKERRFPAFRRSFFKNSELPRHFGCWIF
jgi:hypothetical protein